MNKAKFKKTIQGLKLKLSQYEEDGRFGQLNERISKIKGMSKNFYHKLNDQIVKQD